jgi:hypothetical protein
MTHRIAMGHLLARAVLVLWLCVGATSYAFGRSRGLAYRDADAPSGIGHVRELHSSGGNDDIGIEVGVVLAAVGVLWALVRRGRPFARSDLVAHAVLMSVQILYVLALEVGSIADTVVLDRNVVLALWTVSYAMLFVCLLAGLATLNRSTRRPGTPKENNSTNE